LWCVLWPMCRLPIRRSSPGLRGPDRSFSPAWSTKRHVNALRDKECPRKMAKSGSDRNAFQISVISGVGGRIPSRRARSAGVGAAMVPRRDPLTGGISPRRRSSAYRAVPPDQSRHPCRASAVPESGGRSGQDRRWPPIRRSGPDGLPIADFPGADLPGADLVGAGFPGSYPVSAPSGPPSPFSSSAAR